MPKRICIAVDLDQRTPDVLELGRVLSATTGAAPVLVTVLPLGMLDGDEVPDPAEVEEEAHGALRELAAMSGLDGAELRVLAGSSPARALQDLSEEEDTGLLVVGSTHRGAVGRLLLGGVGERLVPGAACPIAVAPKGYGERQAHELAHIGVGFDGSDESRRALDAAVALAEAAGATLRIISVFQWLHFGATTAGSLPGESANATLRRRLTDAHEEALAALKDRVAVDGRLVEGAADEVLAAESEELDLLVTGSRGYGPRAAVLLGSATTSLVRAGACPLLLTPRETHLELP